MNLIDQMFFGRKNELSTSACRHSGKKRAKIRPQNMSSIGSAPVSAPILPNDASKGLVHGACLIRRSRNKEIILRFILAVTAFLWIHPIALAQSAETPAQQPETEKKSVKPIPLPQTPPVVTPRLTSVPSPQEMAEQAKGLQTNLVQPAPPVPSEPDLEFQEFVASSLGMKLPVFGQNLFENVPSTFAPLDRVQVPGDYMIGPGDELVIRTWGQLEGNLPAIVDRTGAIYIPQVGVVNVAGLKYDELRDYLHSEIGRFFKN